MTFKDGTDILEAFKFTNADVKFLEPLNQFRRHEKLNNQIFERIKEVYFNHDIVIMESPQRKLSFFTFEDLISMKLGLVQSLAPSVTSYAIYKSPIDQQLSYAEFVFNITTLGINF
jgi:hypothetical protein